MTTTLSDYKIEDQMAVSDAEGRVVIRVGLLLTLYFRMGCDYDKRRAVAECFEKYYEQCGENLRWAHPTPAGFKEAKDPNTRKPTEWILEDNAGNGWEFFWHGGEQRDAASHFFIEGLGEEDWPAEPVSDLSYLRFAFPLRWFSNHPGNLPSFAKEICEILSPLHGYGGIGVLESPRESIVQKYDKNVFYMGMRFPGIEIDRPEIHSMYLRDKIKGVNWLTVIGSSIQDKIDQELETEIESEFGLRRFSQGVIIQAGEVPQMGDVNNNLPTEAYRRLATKLSFLRATDHPRMGDGTDGFDLERTEFWLSRFEQ